MTRRMTLLTAALALVVVIAPGCIVIEKFGGAKVWTDKIEDRIDIEQTALNGIKVKTHNGTIVYTSDDAADGAIVEVTKKAGARTKEEAEEALDAIEVFVENDARDGVKNIGWRWSVPRQKNWRAQVSFDITGPSDIWLKAETHNGKIRTDGVKGAVTATTHNGKVLVNGAGEEVHAHTHNGSVEVSARVSAADLSTHNGSVTAHLDAHGPLDGSIVTHNGGVIVNMSGHTSTTVEASTHNGAVQCELPQAATVNYTGKKRRKARATIGDGEGSFTITTHNGSVTIKSQDG